MFSQPTLKFSFECNDNILITKGNCEEADFVFEKKGDRYVVWIVAHKQLTPMYCALSLKCGYADAKVFVNGYQSWTHSKEYTKDMVQKGLRLPVRRGLARTLASACGDYDFVNYSGRKGEFHSFSYTYVRKEQKFYFAGSLDEGQGYTIFRHYMNNGEMKIEKDLEGLVLKENEKYKLFDIFFAEGDKDAVFDAYFDELGVKKPRVKKMCGYTSWYNLFGKIDENSIMRDLEGLSAKAGDVADIFQIDDGYQSAVGDWLQRDESKFPSTMKEICDRIHAKGFKAGLWLAPTVCARNSRIAKEHPEWLVKKDGKPVIGAPGWGGAYVLDYTIKEVKEHIRHVFDVVLNDWGFDMVKLDFLYSECMIPRKCKTRGELMQDTMKFLRKVVGDKLLLGCGVPLFSAFGTCDMCRVGSDVDISFKERLFSKLTNNEIVSTYNAITSSIFRHHLDGRAFANDPDVFFLRNDNLRFTKEQKRLLAKLNSIAGSVLFVSDDAGAYDEESLAVLKEAYATDARIKDVTTVSKNVYSIQYEEDGQQKTLVFDIRKGKILS